MYIKYLLRNVEPIRIKDDSTSQVDQLDTLTYIPGTTMRGVIINALANKEVFLDKKLALFSERVQYRNACMVLKNASGDDMELIPSPKGFYEDKSSAEGKKQIENILKLDQDKEITAGYKRASLGRYCCIEDGCIRFSNVGTGSDIRINTGKHSVFRSQHITKNQLFCGCIAVKDGDVCEVIRQELEALQKKGMLIGNSRFTGYGKCEILKLEVVEANPYEKYIAAKDQKDECYLYLLSNTVMRNEYGEYVGIDKAALAKSMGVENLEICTCSTSTINVKGFNRSWGTKTPDVTMYEMGSVFRLCYTGVLKKERIQQLCDEGIGIRKNEGFGQILIFDKDVYNAIGAKEKFRITEENKKEADYNRRNDDTVVLKIAAKGYYIEKLKKAKEHYIVKQALPVEELNSSQLGAIQAYAVSLKYTPKKAKEQLNEYLEHALEKDEHAKKHSNILRKRQQIKCYIDDLFEADLEKLLNIDFGDKIMGIRREELFSEEEILKWKLQLLVDMIRYKNRLEVAEK